MENNELSDFDYMFTDDEERYRQQYHAVGYFVGKLLCFDMEKQNLIEALQDIISEEIKHQGERISELEASANYDGLTKLLEREPFERIVQKEFIDTTRQNDVNRMHSLLFMDLDDFKSINSLYGHLEGDECLVHAAKAIQSSLRRDNDYACRWGGEEFVILLGDTDSDGAYTVAKRIQKSVNEIHPGQGVSESKDRLGISIGIAQYPHGADFMSIFKPADDALLLAKSISANKNQILYAEQGLPTDQK